MISLALLAILFVLLPFAIRASTKRRDPSRGVRWQGIQWSAPDESDAALARGLAKQKAGDLTGALLEYDRALAGKRTAIALNNRGCARMEAGQMEGALVDLREAVAIDPESATAHCSLAEALARSGELGAALESLRRAASLDPAWRVYAETADAFEALRQTEAGRSWLTDGDV